MSDAFGTHTLFAMPEMDANLWSGAHRALKDCVISSTTTGVRQLWTLNDGEHVRVDPFEGRFNLTESGLPARDTQKAESLWLASDPGFANNVEINPNTTAMQILSGTGEEILIAMAWLLVMHEMHPGLMAVKTKAAGWQWAKALRIAQGAGYSSDELPWPIDNDGAAAPVAPFPVIEVPENLDFRA
ncbi:hypothetical protein [Marinobacter sp.]|uniref:hypothetical protein n=1 Tax=Marinobacter sp. TaxID=50741 RepID=UPI002615DC0B|nr:hypothetical protein [Marinobacter sp.]